MSIKTRVAYTYEEVSPGVPYWGPNTVTTDLLPDQSDIAIENLVSGRTYYVKTWNEDQFGNKSREILRAVNTPTPTRVMPLAFSANGFLDSGSPLYAFVKVPANVKSVDEAAITLAFRQFMAPATAAAASGSLTSDSGGGSTSGSSSAASSNNASETFGLGTLSNSGTSGAASTGTAHTHSVGSYATPDSVISAGGHSHPIPHTHSTPSHQHTVPTHSHALTYGTFEEAYPVSHSVSVATYKRSGGAWTLMNTVSGLTADLEDLDLTAVITGPGDWRIQVQSAAAQPNGGRLGCDLYGTLSVVV